MLNRLLTLTAAMSVMTAAPAFAQSTAHTPASTPTPSPAVTPDTGAGVVRIGNHAVLTIREGLGSVSLSERTAVIQSRITQVLLHHPYLTAAHVKVVNEGGLPVIYWGPFPIVSVDLPHARHNNFSNPEILAQAWANNIRSAINDFMAAKKLPERALYRNERQSDFTYRRTERMLTEPTVLTNSRYIFTPEDFEYGAGIKEKGQHGYVVFLKRDAGTPPKQIYLGNSQGTFTEYEWISPEDTP